MKKFKVGQKVKVRENLQGGRDYDGVHFNEMMEGLRGKEFEIAPHTTISWYKLKGDHEVEKWVFSEAMLEEVKNPPTVLNIEQPVKLEIYVDRIIVNDPATIMFYRTPNYSKDTGEFVSWGDQKKVVAKANTSIGDEYDVSKGVDVATLKAFRKEIDKQLRKF